MKFLTGTVYSKALAIFLAAALGLLGAAAALTQIIILREFERSEQREMAAMLQRFSLVMARETLPMEAALGEWSRVRKTTDAGGAGGGWRSFSPRGRGRTMSISCSFSTGTPEPSRQSMPRLSPFRSWMRF